MMLFIVIEQEGLGDEPHGADFALVGSFSGVVEHVGVQGPLLSEALSALFAPVRPLSGVGTHVQFQGGPQCETSPALFAFYRLETLVDQQVIAQARLGADLFTAVVAHEPLTPVLVHPDVVVL